MVSALLTAAPRKTIATSRGENEDLVITVTLYIDPPAVKEIIGSDLDGHYIVGDVKVEPKYGKEVTIDRDDFQLRTDKDGEKAKPFAPSQIAGRGALVISQKGGGGAGMAESGPGYGMPGPMGGPPVMMPGNGGSIGSGPGAGESTAEARVVNDPHEKENPLLKTLEQKILKEGKTKQPATGLLYFAMEKQKMKDLELTYGGKENRITLRFK
jgi:hypothetical protein